MPTLFRRAALATLIAGLAAAVPGLPASAGTSTTAPATRTAAVAASDYTVEKTGGATALSQQNPRGNGGAVFDSRKAWDNGARTVLWSKRTVSFSLDVGALAVPSDATAVILNVTAIAPTRPGWLTVWPSDRSRPTASTLNFAPGTPTPNLAVVPVTASHRLNVLNGSAGSTDVLVSFEGWIRSNGAVQRPGSVTPTTGTRVIDTRTAGPAVPAKGYRDVTVRGHGVPVAAGAALLNVVAVKPTRAGYLVAHPSDTARPTSTALTYRVGFDRAAMTLTKLSATGTVRVWNMSSAPVHLVVDSFGWVAAGDASGSPAGTQALTPRRLLDTRASVPVSVGSQSRVPLSVYDKGEFSGRPSGLVLAITATGATRSGYLQVDVKGADPNGAPVLTPALVNYAPGETVTNTAYVPVPPYGDMTLRVNTGTVHAVIDVVGVVAPQVQVDGRVVTEADGQPVYPGLVGIQPKSLYKTTETRSDGRFTHTTSFAPQGISLCGTAASSTGVRDPAFAMACLGGTVAPVVVPTAIGSRITIGDVRVPRVGTASGRVSSPAATTPAGSLAVLQRVDNAYLVTADVGSDGAWRMPSVPAGTYVAHVRGPDATLVGETLDEVPLDVTGGITSNQQRLDRVLDSTALKYVVTAAGTTIVDDASLLAPGTLKGVVVDPDGNLGDVTVSIRHSSGYLVSTGAASTVPLTRSGLRPGAYTLCATENTTTVCSGGASSWQAATPVAVVSGATVETTVTLP